MYGNERAIALFERGQRGIPKRPVLDRELKDWPWPIYLRRQVKEWVLPALNGT